MKRGGGFLHPLHPCPVSFPYRKGGGERGGGLFTGFTVFERKGKGKDKLCPDKTAFFITRKKGECSFPVTTGGGVYSARKGVLLSQSSSVENGVPFLPPSLLRVETETNAS